MKRILVIRRDNIGDLVCTTPLFAALRQRHPDAWIAALVNSYNAPALAGNPDIDEIFVYEKGKHRAAGKSLLGVWWDTFGMLRRLRSLPWDTVFVATTAPSPSTLKFARALRARRVIGYGSDTRILTDILAPETALAGHECEAVIRLLEPLGETALAGPVRVFPKAAAIELLRPLLPAGRGPLIGLHLSARKPLQRWPVECFAALARSLVATYQARILLFWAPGAETHPQHPGDDGKSAQMQTLCRDLPLAPCPTHSLDELIAGLSLCDQVICSDGGTLHLAAGLGKPIVCFFGNSSATRWHPWGVPYQLLQKESGDVADISVDEALAAYQTLVQGLLHPGA